MRVPGQHAGDVRIPLDNAGEFGRVGQDHAVEERDADRVGEVRGGLCSQRPPHHVRVTEVGDPHGTDGSNRRRPASARQAA